MPTISLRLTEDEHTQLKEWAFGSRRSMQREAVYRIFTDALGQRRPDEPGRDGEETSRAPDAYPHFKPDFK